MADDVAESVTQFFWLNAETGNIIARQLLSDATEAKYTVRGSN